MTQQMIPVVVLGTHTVGLGVVRSLSGLGVPIIGVYYDANDMGFVSRCLSARYQAPHPEKHEDQFIQFLLELSARLGRSLLVPASDATLAAVSRHKSELEQGYIVACVDWKIAELFINKKHTYALADAIGVPAPRTLVPVSVEQVEEYGRTVQYPCLVKPSQSHQFFDVFRTKMVRVENLDQMVTAYKQAADAGLEVVLQEIIPGGAPCGVNYNSYSWDGNPVIEFTARKVRNAPPEFGSPCAAQSEPVPEVLESGRRILKAMGFYGYSCTEFKKDPRDGVYKLMEVNGRHNLSSLLAVRCGLNFPVIQYRHLVLGEYPSCHDYQPGIYWIDLTRDLYYHAMPILKLRSSPREFLGPYLGKHVFAILDFKDLKPFVKRCTDLIKDNMQSQPDPNGNKRKKSEE